MRAVRAIGAEPFGKHARFAGARGTLAKERVDFQDRHCECVPRFCSGDKYRPRLRIATGLRVFIAAVGVRANLPAKRIFAFDQDFIARSDANARLFVTGEFVNQFAEGQVVEHGYFPFARGRSLGTGFLNSRGHSNFFPVLGS